MIRNVWGARAALSGLLLLGVGSTVAAQGFEVRLKTAWAKAYADRATISAAMQIHHSHKRPNKIAAGGNDGDIHFSGESDDIGLPFVAEIVNAAMPGQRQAVQLVRATEGEAQPLAITGAWRLWFEHPAATQTQGANNPFDPDNTNPSHSFEIHPVSMVGTLDVRASFVPIPKYQAYPADVAFPYFESCVATIKASNSGLSIRSKKLKYNYVSFDIELAHKPRKVSDGYVALASIVGDGDEKIIEDERRMVFVAGTPAAEAIKDAVAGDRFTVLGIPRVSLARVLQLVKKRPKQQIHTALPYEMIIVGVK